MSGGTIKGGYHQIGADGTASNNFTWYQPAVADGTVRLGVGVAGATTSDVMTANNSGNLGIGTTSPAGALDIRSGSDNPQLQIRKNSGGDSYARFNLYNTSTAYFQLAASPSTTDASSIMNVYTNGSGGNIMSLLGNGNVGIGTTSPDFKLVIQDATAATRLRIVNNNNGAAGCGVFMQVYNGASVVSDCTITSDNAGNCKFFTGTTSSSERMRIDANGDVEIGKTDGSQNTQGILLNSYGTGRFTATGQQAIWANRLASDGQVIAFTRSTTQVGNISVTTSATTYNSGSDYRLKDNIVPMTGALDKVLQLNPVTFTWKIDGKDGQGFIAHELAEIIPDAVTGEKDAVDAEGNPEYQSVDPRMVVATLVAAIKELKAEIDALKGAN